MHKLDPTGLITSVIRPKTFSILTQSSLRNRPNDDLHNVHSGLSIILNPPSNLLNYEKV